MARVEAEYAMQAEATATLPLVGTPQRSKAATGAVGGDGETLQFGAVGGASRPHRPGITRLRRKVDGFVEQSHG
jgi:hypothetical protein